ncbi:MAG: calcium-binding protein, partial [Caulobacteraceae bacterium]
RLVNATPPKAIGDERQFVRAPVAELAGLTFNADGTWTFDPNANPEANALNRGEIGFFSFTVVANDGQADSAPQTITITVFGENEQISGDVGNNVITGDSAPNDIYGLDGNDTLNGADGNDFVFGGNGSDTLNGGQGNDELNGGAGADKLYGGAGSDTLFGGEGNDTLRGEDGDDFVYGDNGNDTIDGGLGNDDVRGDDGNDVVKGGAGDDQVHGGWGDDIVAGDAGNDTIYGGMGKDSITGGAGADTFVFFANETGNTVATADTITDYKAAQGDVIQFAMDVSFTQVAEFTGSAGQLTLQYDSVSNVTVLSGDVDGDMTADLVILLSGNIPTVNFV